MKKKVKVFDTPYKLNSVESFADPSQNGEIDFDERTISIVSTLNEDSKFVTLVHELIHASLKEMKHPQYKNEKLVTPLAVGVGEALIQLGVRV